MGSMLLDLIMFVQYEETSYQANTFINISEGSLNIKTNHKTNFRHFEIGSQLGEKKAESMERRNGEKLAI